jgi:hypothetical protein
MGGRDDVDAVVALFEARGFVHDGGSVALIFGIHEGKLRFSHTEQLRIERNVAEKSRAAAIDKTGALPDAAIRTAIKAAEAGDASIRFTREQRAAIHALGGGGNLSLLTGVAGSGKTTLLKPLVDAWHEDGRKVIGMSTAWRQADALKETGADETWALQRSSMRSTPANSRRTPQPFSSSTRSARSGLVPCCGCSSCRPGPA